jgi:hypothetical protein
MRDAPVVSDASGRKDRKAPSQRCFQLSWAAGMVAASAGLRDQLA